ncbi:MAG: leucine-rich repeat protein [Oscillospiraceae bacterium]|nr:leucine-rich repeat protein [Oscillospiraceae bacterium]
MNKRILLSSLLLLLLCSVFTMPARADVTWRVKKTDVIYSAPGGNIYFDKFTGTITGADTTVTEAVIPEKIEGVPVVKIGMLAFRGGEPLKAPESVAFIFGADGTKLSVAEYNAQKLSHLRRVVLPDSVREIEESAFQFCTELTEVRFGSGLKTIGQAAFWHCYALSAVTIPDSVTSIGMDAFRQCTSLQSITFGTGISVIPVQCCTGCTALTDVTFRAPITEIGQAAFGSCKSLSSLELTDAFVTLGDGALSGTSLETIELPSSLVTIGASAFADCEKLTSIVIPDSVTSLGDRAFQDCVALKSCRLSNSLTSMGKWLFAGDTALSTIVIPALTANHLSKWNLANACFSQILIEGSPTVIPKHFITDIAEGGHTNASFSITIPRSVKKIEYQGYGTVHDQKRFNLAAVINYEGSEEEWNAIERDLYRVLPPDEDSIFIYHPYTLQVNFNQPMPPVTQVSGFLDVRETDYFADAVTWAKEKGVTLGKGAATRFAPRDSVSRGEAVTFLWRAMGQPEPTSAASPFTDVGASDFFCKPVLWAVENGITNGTGDGTTFSPNSPVTREQLAIFLYRAMGEPGKTGAGAYYDDALRWANGKSLLDGTEISFRVGAPCPRCDVVTYLFRALV